MEKLTTADRLHQIMRERNLKQIDILEMCEPVCRKYNVKIGKSALSQYVNGTVVPGQDKLLILCEVFKVNQAWLMGYDVPMEIEREKLPIEKKDISKEARELAEAFDSFPENKKEQIRELIDKLK